MDIFEHASQIIVHARVDRNPRELCEEKNFRKLVLPERESVKLSFERAGSTPRGPWRDITIEIHYHAENVAEPIQLERWYLGLEGKPKIQKRQLSTLYRALYLHLRLAPLFQFKARAIYPIVLRYTILKGRPSRPLQGEFKANTIFKLAQPEGGLTLATDHLTSAEVEKVLHNNPSATSASATPPIAIPGRRNSLGGGSAGRLSTGSPVLDPRRRAMSAGQDARAMHRIAQRVAARPNTGYPTPVSPTLQPSPSSPPEPARNPHPRTAPICIPGRAPKLTIDSRSNTIADPTTSNYGASQSRPQPQKGFEGPQSPYQYYSSSNSSEFRPTSLPSAMRSPPGSRFNPADSFLPFASPQSYQSGVARPADLPSSFKEDFLKIKEDVPRLAPSPPLRPIGSELSLDSLSLHQPMTESPSLVSISFTEEESHEELPFAMEEAGEAQHAAGAASAAAPRGSDHDSRDLDAFLQKCSDAPTLSMFQSRQQDMSQSIMALDNDLRAVRDEYDLFSQSIHQSPSS